jgi:hypothetical protein
MSNPPASITSTNLVDQHISSRAPASITSTNLVDQHISLAPDSSTNTHARSAHHQMIHPWSAPARIAADTDSSRLPIGVGIGSAEARRGRYVHPNRVDAAHGKQT